MENIIDILRDRGLIEAITSEEVYNLVKEPQSFYLGIDPTADSLHLGHLLSLIIVSWFQKCGHRPVLIVGGATGMIGDPSGKSEERQLLNEEALRKNLDGISKNIETILKNLGGQMPKIVNNYDWFKNFSFIDFLRDIGKYFRLGVMLGKESVKQRVASEEGMSLTEFSYQALQAYDFLYLNENENVTIQIGGSDQWGNITAGMDLVQKVKGKSVYGLTFPLLTRSDGKKFGKSEKGAIWVSKERMSPYKFYQHLISIPDADVIKFMRMLTFMELSEIEKYEEMMKSEDYIPNTAQKRLAEEITTIVHGKEGLKKALEATGTLLPGSEAILDSDTLESIDVETVNLSYGDSVNAKLIDIAASTGIVGSKGDARRLIRNRGLRLNNKSIEDENATLTASDLSDNNMFVLGRGKKEKIRVKLS